MKTICCAIVIFQLHHKATVEPQLPIRDRCCCDAQVAVIPECARDAKQNVDENGDCY